MRDKVIIAEGPEIWIVDSETHDWFFQYDWRNTLYYNKKFFNEFFSLFSLQEYSPLLKTWFENLGLGTVQGVSRKNTNYQYLVTQLLDNKKKWSFENRYGFPYSLVKKMISFKKTLNKPNLQVEDFFSKDVEFSKILY